MEPPLRNCQAKPHRHRTPVTKPQQRVDLHGLRPEAALRRVAQELHAARVRGLEELVVVTGRGWGNLKQEPVLRGHVERWLASPEARALGVRSTRVVAKGGALEVRLERRNS